jgi:deoxyribodipyrimidine photo-lyase
MSFKKARVRRLNEHATRADGAYVLYWMQMARRMRCNHALDYALAASRTLGVPLVIYEGLRLDYPWASRRLHRFILEGMLDNARDAALLGLTYWPFVEAPGASGRGLLRKLARKAALVVTDDFPCFIVPKQSAALAQKTDAPVHAVDGNCVVPLSLLGAPVSAAAHLRHRIHKLFPEAWAHRANQTPAVHASAKTTLAPPFPLFAPSDLSAFLDSLPVDAAVREVPGVRGGSAAAQEVLDRDVPEVQVRRQLRGVGLGRGHRR